MPELAANWVYPLTEVKGTKRLPRSGTPSQPGVAFDLVGVDAITPGGIRPYCGFKRVHTFQTSNPFLDCFAFDIRVGTSAYAYGFIYRHGTAENANVTLEYRLVTSGSFSAAHTVLVGVSGSAQMNVAQMGRYIFIFIDGRAPTMLFFDDTIGPAPIIITDPGAGEQPICLPFDRNVGWGGITDTGGAAAKGQIMLTDVAPEDSGYFTSSPQTASDVRAIAPGGYAFAFRLYNSKTGRWSPISSIAPINTADFDTTTDTGSNSSDSSDDTVSSLSKYAVLDLLYTKTNPETVGIDAWDYLMIFRSVRVQSAGGTTSGSILHPDNLVALEDYEIDDQPVDTSIKRVRIWYELDDKQLIFVLPYADSSTFDVHMPHGNCGLGYEGTLLISGIKNAEDTAQVVGQGPVKGLGEIRWSSLVELSPELFPPVNRYVPQVPSNEVIQFVKVTGQAIGFSRDRQYHIRKESTYLRTMEIHEGYGLVNPRAVTTVGSLCYFMTPKGVKVVDSNGQLEGLEGLDHLVLREWSTSYKDTQFAYDAYSSTLYILNPTLERAALVWFNSSTITELYDMTFDFCFEGKWPINDSDPTSALVSRAFFVDSRGQVYIIDSDRTKTVSGSETGDDGKARIAMLDFTGDGHATISQRIGNTIYLEIGSGLVGTGAIGAYIYNSSSRLPNTPVYGNKTKIVSRPSQHIIIVENGSGFEVGDRIQISPVFVRWTGGLLGLQDENGQTFGPGDMHQVRHVDSLVAVFSYAEGQVSYAHYAGVLWKGDNSTAYFRALPRKSDGVVPLASAIDDGAPIVAVPFGGTTTSNGRFGCDGVLLFPSVETCITDHDYRMISVKVTGKIRTTERTSRGI